MEFREEQWLPVYSLFVAITPSASESRGDKEGGADGSKAPKITFAHRNVHAD